MVGTLGVMTGFRTTVVSSGLTAGSVVKAAPSIVGSVIVSAAAGASIGIYDHATGASNLVATIPCDGAVTYSVWLGLSMENGIFVKTLSGTPVAITVCWQ